MAGMLKHQPVIIIGGGLAGLACAQRLHQKGQAFMLLEANPYWGGVRVVKSMKALP
jgi:cation diffusion facilitator CzcD-associated flavoprotein CzcO